MVENVLTAVTVLEGIQVALTWNTFLLQSIRRGWLLAPDEIKMSLICLQIETKTY